MPVLCVLSSDGLLFMYHIENQLVNYNNICKPPTEVSDNIITQLFTRSSKIVSHLNMKFKNILCIINQTLFGNI